MVLGDVKQINNDNPSTEELRLHFVTSFCLNITSQYLFTLSKSNVCDLDLVQLDHNESVNQGTDESLLQTAKFFHIVTKIRHLEFVSQIQ